MNVMCGTNPWDGPWSWGVAPRWYESALWAWGSCGPVTWADGPGWYRFGPLALPIRTNRASLSTVRDRSANGAPSSAARDSSANGALSYQPRAMLWGFNGPNSQRLKARSISSTMHPTQSAKNERPPDISNSLSPTGIFQSALS